MLTEEGSGAWDGTSFFHHFLRKTREDGTFEQHVRFPDNPNDDVRLHSFLYGCNYRTRSGLVMWTNEPVFDNKHVLFVADLEEVFGIYAEGTTYCCSDTSEESWQFMYDEFVKMTGIKGVAERVMFVVVESETDE